MNEVKKIEDVIDFDAKTNCEIVKMLQSKSVEVPEWSKLEKAYNPEKHDINDKDLRPDKTRDGKIEKVSRIYIALQRMLVSRITEFMFAIPVKRAYHYDQKDTVAKEVAQAMEKVYKHARIDTVNKNRSRAYFAACEMCTVWYSVKKTNSLYGFNSEYKLNCKTYHPMDGYRLYPFFGEYDDMLAMSFEYAKTIGEQEVRFFETYTDDKWYKWKQDGSTWELVGEEERKLHKIPAIYAHRDAPIWDGLNNLVDEIELTLSRNSDVIAYNAAPILKVVGTIAKGTEEKNESRRVWRVENGGDVGIVSWQQAVESIRYQVEMLLRLFFMQSQMPDISFENMKGLAALTEPAQRALLTDAHLKVGDESGAFIEFFEREANVIKAFLKEANTKWKDKIDNIEVEHIITPFIQNDEMNDITKWTRANGGKALLSHEESIQMAGFSPNASETLKKIKSDELEEAKNRQLINVFNTAE